MGARAAALEDGTMGGLVGFLAGGAQLIDLSVTLEERLPCTWPGHIPFAHKPWSWFEEIDEPPMSCCSLGPYHTNFLLIDEHCGTHIDGPTHFIPPPGSQLPWAGRLGAVSGEQLSLSKLIGPAAVIDASDLNGEGTAGVSPYITADRLERWERHNGALKAGEIVLLQTSWSRHYVSGERGRAFVQNPLLGRSPGWPALHEQAALLLCERGVLTVGIDAPSMGSVHDGARVHQVGLSRGMLFIEMLAELHRLPVRGALFAFLPLKVAGASGGPGRAIAAVERRHRPD